MFGPRPKPKTVILCKRCLPVRNNAVKNVAVDQHQVFLARRLHVRLKYGHLLDCMKKQEQRVANDTFLRETKDKFYYLGEKLNEHELREAWRRLNA